MNEKEYVQSGGCRCPFCGSQDIEGGDREIDDGVAQQEMYCTECDGEWIDVYHLVGIKVIQKGKEQ